MSDLNTRLVATLGKYLKQLEELLPPTHGIMFWAYNREGKDLDLTIFTSHESTAETLRILQTTQNDLIRRESREGRDDERYFEPEAGDGLPRERMLVSSATVTRMGAHDRVRLWVRGGLAGELIVPSGDGPLLVRKLGALDGGAP